MKKHPYARAGKLVVAAAVCLLLLSSLSDTLAIHTYVRDLKAAAVPVQTYHVDSKTVALTFDVGVDEERDKVGDILKQLRENKVKATFFLTGEWVASNPKTAQQIVKAGHEVGRTLYVYKRPSSLSRPEIERQLQMSDIAWKNAGLPDSQLFRAPHADRDALLAKLVRERHEQLITWSVNTDGQEEGSLKHVLADIEHRLHPGDIVRLKSDSESALKLSDVLRLVQEAGYEWSTLSSLQEVSAR